MSELLKEKKILYRLIAIALVTTPLFGLLGGTLFLRFELDKLNYFLQGIFFNFSITLLIWAVTISLLLLSCKFHLLEKLFPRSVISIFLCLSLSILLSSFFSKNFPPPHIRFAAKNIQENNLNPSPVLIKNVLLIAKAETERYRLLRNKTITVSDNGEEFAVSIKIFTDVQHKSYSIS